MVDGSMSGRAREAGGGRAARQERAIRTREAIPEAMVRLFTDVEYETATIAALVERTGLTRGALYFHFPTKEAMARGVLDQVVTREGLVPQTYKLQERVDLGVLLAHRMPQEPMLRAAVQLSVHPKARSMCGTCRPDWIRLFEDLLVEAEERGELLPHAVPAERAEQCLRDGDPDRRLPGRFLGHERRPVYRPGTNRTWQSLDPAYGGQIRKPFDRRVIGDGVVRYPVEHLLQHRREHLSHHGRAHAIVLADTESEVAACVAVQVDPVRMWEDGIVTVRRGPPE